MAPLDLDSLLGPWGANLVQVAVGFAFGFVLESAGFGDSRKLARQFYLKEMTVLKVMFGAIVTAMLLIFWGRALGWIDYQSIYVNPTLLASGMLGGFLLGVGFIIGGFCPGTAWASMATGKIDAMFFIAGVFLGIFLFGEVAPHIWGFFNDAGDLGRLTIPEWLHWSYGATVLAVVVMALGAFWAAEKAEKAFGGKEAA